MYLRIVIASLAVSLLIGAIAHFADPGALLSRQPQFLAYFAVALPAALLSSTWACGWNGAGGQRRANGTPRPAASSGANANARKETGSVKWFSPSKGFGFITRDNGEDIFVHFRSILGNGHRVLREGQRVEFAVTEGTKGLQAEEVAAIE